MHALFFILGG